VAAERIDTIPSAAETEISLIKTHLARKILFALSILLLAVGGALFLTHWWRSKTQPPMKVVVGTSLLGFDRNASFSPDGNEFAFVHYDTETHDQNIFVKALGDEKMVQLTHIPPPGSADCPNWSPNGGTIAYMHTVQTGPTTSENAIFVMTPLGGSQHQIQDLAPEAPCQLSWSPDSKLLAFGNTPAGESSGIFLVSPTGSEVRRLTTAPPRTQDGDAAFSPDGTQIAFIRWVGPTSCDLYLVNARGDQVKRITALNRGMMSPAWTPDSKRIVFAIESGFWGNMELFSVPATGGETERLPFISSNAFSPAFSRQGDKLAFATAIWNSNIWSVPLQSVASSASRPGSSKWPDPSKVIASTRFAMQPQVSPDGNRLAYVSDQDGALAVWLSKPDGSDPFRLATALLGGSPQWSPDGKYIAFDAVEAGHGQINVIRADGGRPTRITSGPYDNGAPTWSADGKWIYFISNRSGRCEVWKAPFQGKEAVQVTEHGGGYAQESQDGKSLYFQKASGDWIFTISPQIWKMPSTGGTEEPVVSVGDPKGDCCVWFWQVTKEGIYFLDNTAKPFPAIKFFSFAGRKTSVLAQLKKTAFGGPGLSVSADRRLVLYSQIDDADSDIMVLENFR
jgi:Tol biopolymer transport system component